MKILKYKVTGTAPLLMHSDATANPLNPFTKRLKAVTGKRQKTDEDHELISRIEFEASMYYSDQAGYFMPAANIDSTLLNSAKHFKQGVLFKQAVQILEDAPFEFKHKKLKPADLYENSQYVDMRTVKVAQAKNVRCRPIFHEWSFEFSLILEEAKLNESDIDKIVENAGLFVGICDYRPRYGRFSVEKA